jgi:hypothetical protein
LAANLALVLLQQYLRQSDVANLSEVLRGSKFRFNCAPQPKSLLYLGHSAEALNCALLDEMKLNLSFNRLREGEQIIDRATSTIESRELTDIGTLGFSGQFPKPLGRAHQRSSGFEHDQDHGDARKRRLDLAAGTSRAPVPDTPDGASYPPSGVCLQDEIAVGRSAYWIPGRLCSRCRAAGEVQGRPLEPAAGTATASNMDLHPLDCRPNLVSTLSQGCPALNTLDFFGRVGFASDIPNGTLRSESSLNRRSA